MSAARHLQLARDAGELYTLQVGNVVLTCWAVPLVVISSGRPPWYDSQGQIAEAFVIGNVFLCYTVCMCSLTAVSCWWYRFGWGECIGKDHCSQEDY